jgi:hypothetical protein
MLKAGTPLILTALLLASCRTVPDSVMQASFERHKDALEQVVAMATSDALSCPIPRVGEAACVSPARLAEYQSLLKSADVLGVSPQWARGCILFPSVQESALIAMQTHVRGYAFAERVPLQPGTEDTAREVGESPIAFKSINGHWYLYFSA